MTLSLGGGGGTGVGGTGLATWHRCADMPFATRDYYKVVSVMNVGGRYMIYMLRSQNPATHSGFPWGLWEYDPYANAWTAMRGLGTSAAPVNDYHSLVTVGRKLYLFLAQPTGNPGGISVYVWDHDTNLWSSASGASVIILPPGDTDLRWISAVYLPSEPTTIRVWFQANGIWQYYRWTIGTATFTGGAAGITAGSTNYLHGLWKDTDSSPTQSLEQKYAGNSIREVFRRTWNPTTPSAQTRVDSPVSEFNLSYGGEAEFNTTRIGYEYDQSPPPGVANVVANPWMYDGDINNYPNLKVIPGGLKVITPAGQTFWLGPNWTLAGTSTWPSPTTPGPLPWDSYIPALGLSDTYSSLPIGGLPTARYGKGLRTVAICYAAGCIFLFGGFIWGLDYLFGDAPQLGLTGSVPYVLRYGDIAAGAGDLVLGGLALG